MAYSFAEGPVKAEHTRTPCMHVAARALPYPFVVPGEKEISIG